MLFCRLLIFSKSTFSKKNCSGISSECLTVWIQIRPDNLLGLVWLQTVCKGYQQTTLVGKELKNDVPLLWAVVDTGDIAFYEVRDLLLPVDITMG